MKLVSIVTAILGFAGISHGAVADAYLDSLKAAAEGVEVDPKTSKASSGADGSNTGGGPDTAIPTGLSQPDFESFLQQRYFGSFSFYKKLDAERQRSIYKAYADRPDVEHVRNEIKQQYLSK
ncbi:MAG: hypothetical protein ACFCUJ_00100 [Thiotrichales bacterium]